MRADEPTEVEIEQAEGEALFYQVIALRSALSWVIGLWEGEGKPVPMFIMRTWEQTDPTRVTTVLTIQDGKP